MGTTHDILGDRAESALDSGYVGYVGYHIIPNLKQVLQGLCVGAPNLGVSVQMPSVKLSDIYALYPSKLSRDAVISLDIFVQLRVGLKSLDLGTSGRHRINGDLYT